MGRFVKGGALSGAKKSGPRNHQELRECQCAWCFGRKSLRKISKEMDVIIKKFSDSFSLDNDALPIMICDKCRVAMSYIAKVFSLPYITSHMLTYPKII